MTDISMANSTEPEASTPCPFHTLPPEILLDIISAVPFTPCTFLSLRLTCRRFHGILTQHEGPIALAARRRTFDPATATLFPGLESSNFQKLNRLYTRTQALEALHEQWMEITQAGELDWLRGRFEPIHKAGVLLLWHLHDLHPPTTTHPHLSTAASTTPTLCTHCRRTHFLRSLPATSLASLLFALVASVRVLRVHGPEPILESWHNGDIARRSDVELVGEELMLSKGPWFFLALVRPERDARATGRAIGHLEAEISHLPYRQSPLQPATLISVLRRTLAEKMDVDVRFAVSKMWEVLASTGFDALEDEKGAERMRKVVRGEEWTAEEKGMKRIF